MIETASPYPEALVQSLAAGPAEAEVTVSLIAGPDRHTTDRPELVSELLPRRVTGRALPGARHRPVRPRPRKTAQRYSFLEFIHWIPLDVPAPSSPSSALHINGRFWLHLGEGWRFFAPDNYITRLTAVLDAEPHVFQVGIDFADAAKLTGVTAAEQTIRRTPTPAATSSPTRWPPAQQCSIPHA